MFNTLYGVASGSVRGTRIGLGGTAIAGGLRSVRGMLLAASLGAVLPGTPALADSLNTGLSDGFSPIPAYMIFPPLKPQGTADDALATGHVVEEAFPMATPATRPWRLAFLFPHMKDPYWTGCNYGVISEARRLGVHADILPADGYDDLIGQLRKLDESLAAKYDAIVISPISLTGNNPSIAKARARGIPVFELANDSTSDDLTIKVTTSLKAMGVSATEWVIRDAQRRGLKSVNIGLLPGPEDAGWVKGEVAGTREAVRKAPIKVHIVDIKYGDSDLIGQTKLAAQLISEHGKQLDYILGCTGCAPAAILPIKEAGLTGKVRVVAYDLTREIADAIRDGDIAASADTKAVSQARVVINAVVNHLEGRTRKSPHTILVKLGLVDRNNYGTYKFDTSIAPNGYMPVRRYAPAKP